MAKKQKNQVIENQVVATEVTNQVVECETVTTEATTEVTKTDLELAQDEVAKAKEAMVEARRKLAEAKKQTSKSRPVRKFGFKLYCDGTYLTKSDVHYVVEKAAIDALTESIKNGDNNESTYTLVRYEKDDEENTLYIETLALDPETKQIVIS